MDEEPGLLAPQDRTVARDVPADSHGELRTPEGSPGFCLGAHRQSHREWPDDIAAAIGGLCRPRGISRSTASTDSRRVPGREVSLKGPRAETQIFYAGVANSMRMRSTSAAGSAARVIWRPMTR